MIEARKSGTAGVICGISLLLCAALLSCSITDENIPLAVINGMMALVCLGILVDYLRTPMRPFYIDEHDRLVLHDGTVLEMQDIWDVSYRNAAGRGILYSWGRVTISSGLGKLKYRYICDCEEITKSLLRRVYAARGQR